jgi:hypothetical protein
MVGCNLAGVIIVYFFLYESSNLSLESVDMVRFALFVPFLNLSSKYVCCAPFADVQ